MSNQNLWIKLNYPVTYLLKRRTNQQAKNVVQTFSFVHCANEVTFLTNNSIHCQLDTLLNRNLQIKFIPLMIFPNEKKIIDKLSNVVQPY